MRRGRNSLDTILEVTETKHPQPADSDDEILISKEEDQAVISFTLEREGLTCGLSSSIEEGKFDRKGLVVPPYDNIILPLPSVRTSVEVEMPIGSSDTIGTPSFSSHVTSNSSRSTTRSHVKVDGPAVTQYHGAEAWWSVGDFLHPGITHQNVSLSLARQHDDIWDLSDSLVDIYREVNQSDSVDIDHDKVDVKQWIEEDTSHGFVRVYASDTDTNPKKFPCNLSTTAQKLCFKCGMPPNSLHVQFNGDIIRRLDPFDCPLAIQNEYLHKIGYTDVRRIQEVSSLEELQYLVKFYAGKPVSDSTYSRNQLSTYAYVRKGKLIYQWVRRLCIITGTRLLIYRDKTKSTKPTTVQLAKGSVEEAQVKGHDFCLKLTSTLQGERSVYLSFADEKDYSKWLRKTKKATAKLPTKADLSNCHLEFLPETVFINEELQILNLRHNVLKERPIEEDIYTIGWLDDLPRFMMLRSLNLADNDLHTFPMALCRMRMLVELNIASNKLEELPAEICEMESLQMLHIHNNHLTSLPEEMCGMQNLIVLVIAFNHFTTIPNVLLNTQDSLLRIDSLIMAGNMVERLPPEVLQKMAHIRKIDFRMNKLCLMPSEMAKFHLLEHVTHLDVRDNEVTDLDIRALKALEYLNCERNQICSLQLNGASIKTLLAANNEISTFSVSPKPEWLVNMDISHNQLTFLPSWVCECFFLVQLNASHNQLMDLPPRLLCDAQKLKVMKVGHNKLRSLPHNIHSEVLEELHLENNALTSLPDCLFRELSKLKCLCVTNNQLETVPQPNRNLYQNKLQELYISFNRLQDEAVTLICSLQRLRILHMAHNDITEIHDKDLRRLDSLQELNISGNKMRHLPRCLGRHTKLQILRANANLLKELPDVRYSTNLKVLEVSSNRLVDVSVASLMDSQVNLLDISGNPEMQLNRRELKGIKSKKRVCMVDIKGQNRSLLDMRTGQIDDISCPWQSGQSQTSGIRNKLSVSILNRPRFNDGSEGLFALFDGGRSDEVIRLLCRRIESILKEEAKDEHTAKNYLKYTMLTAHRKLQTTGQKVGASGAICHLTKTEGSSNYVLHMANIGDTEVVLCRRGEATCISKLFTVTDNKEECQRIHKTGGIITEDNRINGVTSNTRLLGSSYLFPHVTPDPHTAHVTIQPEDQMIIMASQGLWKYISYQEAVDEVFNIPDPVLGAKRLQDMAQGYGSQENIAVLVVRLLSSGERFRMKTILQTQFVAEQQLLAALKQRDMEREENKKKQELENTADAVPMEIVKLKGGRKRKQVTGVFGEGESMEGSMAGSEGFIGNSEASLEIGEGVKLRPLPHAEDDDVDASQWELVLQKRLTEEVKGREMFSAICHKEDGDVEVPHIPVRDDNWTTVSKSNSTSSAQTQVKNRYITAPPVSRKKHAPPPPHTPPPPPHHSPVILPESDRASVQSVEFKRELRHPLNIDRDAILFHQMQMSRNKNYTVSSDSLDSTQSDPSYPSMKEVAMAMKSSSHSIEVLLHSQNSKQVIPHRATHHRAKSVGGSVPGHQSGKDGGRKRTSVVDSCPTDVTGGTEPQNDRIAEPDFRGSDDSIGDSQTIRGSNDSLTRFQDLTGSNDTLHGSLDVQDDLDIVEDVPLSAGTQIKREGEEIHSPPKKHLPMSDDVVYEELEVMRTNQGSNSKKDFKSERTFALERPISQIEIQDLEEDEGISEDFVTGSKPVPHGNQTKFRQILERFSNDSKEIQGDYQDEGEYVSLVDIYDKKHYTDSSPKSTKEFSVQNNTQKQSDKRVELKDMSESKNGPKSFKKVRSDVKSRHSNKLDVAVRKGGKSNTQPKMKGDHSKTVNGDVKYARFHTEEGKSETEFMVLGAEEGSSDTAVYAKVKKVKSVNANNSNAVQGENSVQKENNLFLEEYRHFPETDYNSNSITSLEDLLAYNRQYSMQAGLVKYKNGHKVAAPVQSAPCDSLEPHPDSIVKKTASQRSIVITYL